MKSGSTDRDILYQHAPRSNLESVILSSLVSVDSSKWELELVIPQTAGQLAQVLEQFAGPALEDNLFFSTEFLAAAFRRMNALDTKLIVVWEQVGSSRIMQMYFPVVESHAGLRVKKIWRSWSHDYAPLGTPIIAQNDADEILEKCILLLQNFQNPQFPLLEFSDVPLEGRFANSLQAVTERMNSPIVTLPMATRAMLGRLNANSMPDGLVDKAKKLRQFRRQQRRLSEMGQFTLERVDDYSDVILRFEEFLLLETKSWKGRKGTSIHMLKRTAAFARQSVTDLAKNGHAAIFSLRLDGKAIASLIVLNNNGIFYPWKIAYDQEYALYSPGALLMLRVSEMLAGVKGYKKVDSLAGENNTLVNGIWKKRLELGSLLLPMGNTSQSALEKVADSIRFKQQIRKNLKHYLKR